MRMHAASRRAEPGDGDGRVVLGQRPGGGRPSRGPPVDDKQAPPICAFQSVALIDRARPLHHVPAGSQPLPNEDVARQAYGGQANFSPQTGR